jgi:hemolysin activation/secretion protein
VWGDYPFHEAAFLGGARTVRGFTQQRFAGDASLYGNLELRLALTRFFLVVPGKVGVFGLSDAGRVYLASAPSDRWHTAAGGGVWAWFVYPANVLTLAVARSAERTTVNFKAGFAF